MRYIGFFAVLAAAFIVSREYTRYMKKRLRECEGFLAFINHMRTEMGCFMRPISEMHDGYSADVLADFTRILADTKNINEAYKAVEESLSLSKEEKDVLSKLFSRVGVGYLEDSIRLVDSSYSSMESLCVSLRSESEKNIKLVSMLSLTSALGFLILVI